MGMSTILWQVRVHRSSRLSGLVGFHLEIVVAVTWGAPRSASAISRFRALSYRGQNQPDAGQKRPHVMRQSSFEPGRSAYSIIWVIANVLPWRILLLLHA